MWNFSEGTFLMSDMLLLHSGSLNISQLVAAAFCLIVMGFAFTGLTIWLAAQTIVAFRKDASRKRVARHAIESKRSPAR